MKSSFYQLSVFVIERFVYKYFRRLNFITLYASFSHIKTVFLLDFPLKSWQITIVPTCSENLSNLLCFSRWPQSLVIYICAPETYVNLVLTCISNFKLVDFFVKSLISCSCEKFKQNNQKWGQKKFQSIMCNKSCSYVQ